MASRAKFIGGTPESPLPQNTTLWFSTGNEGVQKFEFLPLEGGKYITQTGDLSSTLWGLTVASAQMNRVSTTALPTIALDGEEAAIQRLRVTTLSGKEYEVQFFIGGNKRAPSVEINGASFEVGRQAFVAYGEVGEEVTFTVKDAEFTNVLPRLVPMPPLWVRIAEKLGKENSWSGFTPSPNTFSITIPAELTDFAYLQVSLKRPEGSVDRVWEEVIRVVKGTPQVVNSAADEKLTRIMGILLEK